MADCQDSARTIRDLKKEVESAQKETARLQHWKDSQLAKMAKLESAAKKYDILTGLDFDRLEKELTHKQREALLAQRRRQNAGARRLTRENAIEKKEANLRKIIDQDKREAAALRERSRALRAERRGGGGLRTRGNDDDEEQHALDTRARQVEQRYLELQRENAELRLSLQAATKTTSGTMRVPDPSQVPHYQLTHHRSWEEQTPPPSTTYGNSSSNRAAGREEEEKEEEERREQQRARLLAQRYTTPVR